ncbi:MAG: hypothetical protein CMH61_02845 [Nanoarchaeota archaeon]|nr:hypothetical protein [Nanoarchaeota archaeon]|tara:strand:- start:466 stop:846 length:381 start_codon:yes stop_codon:yes gene_type:complete
MNFHHFEKTLLQYVKFVFGGGLSLILNLIVTYLLTELLGLFHMLSFTIALGAEILFLFGYHSKVTFKTNGKFLLFAVVILFISGINWLSVYFLSVTIGIHYLAAIIISAGIISIVNYAINKKIVFK